MRLGTSSCQEVWDDGDGPAVAFSDFGTQAGVARKCGALLEKSLVAIVCSVVVHLHSNSSCCFSGACTTRETDALSGLHDRFLCVTQPTLLQETFSRLFPTSLCGVFVLYYHVSSFLQIFGPVAWDLMASAISYQLSWAVPCWVFRVQSGAVSVPFWVVSEPELGC